MIERVDILHFKCFDELSLPLAKMTLLSGANAAGKSTLLQALALLQQTMREHEWSNRLVLNGDSVKLGTANDVVDKVHGRFSFEIGLECDGKCYNWTFSAEERSGMSMAVEKIIVDRKETHRPSSLQFLLPVVHGDMVPSVVNCLRSLTYLTAERVGPREFYVLEDGLTATVVGPAGEHAVSILHSERDKLVRTELVLGDNPPTLLHQVEARMRQFFPGCSIRVQPVPQANAVTLGLRTSDDDDFHRPIHAGFGLTQVLPIVVAALSATHNSILLIENPEVHLHPAGQALMGSFLADVAGTGVQVILETHSDHVLNGVRRAVKRGFSPENVALYFFQPRSDDGAQVVAPQMDAAGNIDEWPTGFFDQYDKDMSYFAGWGD
ncbi:MAG: DUF3696 domain-containing protein [Alphaproteobacteria bacterium]